MEKNFIDYGERINKALLQVIRGILLDLEEHPEWFTEDMIVLLPGELVESVRENIESRQQGVLLLQEDA